MFAMYFLTPCCTGAVNDYTHDRDRVILGNDLFRLFVWLVTYTVPYLSSGFLFIFLL